MNTATTYFETQRPSTARCRGMSSFDAVVALVAILILLSLMVAVSDGLVSDSARDQTKQVLTTLNKCLDAYHRTHDAWPSATEPLYIDTPMARCMAALRSSPATASLVADLPGQTTTELGFLTLQDAFGRPMLYIDPSDPSPEMKRLVASFPRTADDRPFIVSAGPDGDFGDLSSDDPARRMPSNDNLDTF